MSASSDLFTFCEEKEGENATTRVLLQCVAQQIQQNNEVVDQEEDGRPPTTTSVIFCAALVFFMQAGFAMICAGAVRKKNVQNSMMKNLLDSCGASLAFYAVGYGFAFGGSDDSSSGHKTFIGNNNFFLIGVDDFGFWLFQYAYSATSTTIVAGTLAERCQMAAYLLYSLVLAGWVYPIVVHAVWNPNGILSAYSPEPLWGVGMVDMAGSGVVHVTGGVTALFAAIILGPRRDRFYDETGQRLNKPTAFPGNSVSLQMLGTFILWFGWYGFNGGSALLLPNAENRNDIMALAAVNTTLSAGTAALTALLVNFWYLDRYTGEPYFDLTSAMNGVLSGLVAIASGCGVVEPWAAPIVGFVAGILYLLGSHALIALRIDDAVDAIPVHLSNGLWGLTATGLLASTSRLEAALGRADHPGFLTSLGEGSPDGTLLGTQIVGMLFILGWVVVMVFPFFIWIDWRGWFRADPLEEIVGLDTSYHSGLALLSATGELDEVDPRYIREYRRKREERIRKHLTPTGDSTTVVEEKEENEQ